MYYVAWAGLILLWLYRLGHVDAGSHGNSANGKSSPSTIARNLIVLDLVGFLRVGLPGLLLFRCSTSSITIRGRE